MALASAPETAPPAAPPSPGTAADGGLARGAFAVAPLTLGLVATLALVVPLAVFAVVRRRSRRGSAAHAPLPRTRS